MPPMPPQSDDDKQSSMSLFELLLWAELACVSALLLSAVLSTGWKTSIALTAHCLITVERFSQEGQRRVVDSASKTQNKMQSTLLLNVIIRESATVFQLLSGKNQSLLIRRNAFLVLDLGFHIIDCVARLHIERNSLTC